MNTQKVINDYVSFMERMAADNSHGYSQRERSLYNITNPTSFDCSSLTLTAIYYAFLQNGMKKQADYIKAHCSYTGNMLNLVNVGFEIVARNQTAHANLQRGDIELNTTYHVCVATDHDHIVHARSSEGTTDTKDGSGNEIRVQYWYRYSSGWTHRLRFTGKGLENVEPEKVEEKTAVLEDADYFDEKLAGTYICDADELNVRKGAGTNKKIIGVLKNGQECCNYGYYNKLSESKWLLIQFLDGGVIKTGYASMGVIGQLLRRKSK